jgi:hypothetical protein
VHSLLLLALDDYHSTDICALHSDEIQLNDSQLSLDEIHNYEHTSPHARGSAFNEDGIGHSVYAGELPQNSRNTASVSQYDTACLGGPPAG